MDTTILLGTQYSAVLTIVSIRERKSVRETEASDDHALLPYSACHLPGHHQHVAPAW